MRRAAPRARELRAPLEARGRAHRSWSRPATSTRRSGSPRARRRDRDAPRGRARRARRTPHPGHRHRAAIAAHGLGDRVTVHHDVTDDDFRAWLVAADVAVDLRFPHRGRGERLALDGDAGGRPDDRLRDRHVSRHPGGAGRARRPGPGRSRASSRRGSCELRDDPERRARIGAAARAHMARAPRLGCDRHGATSEAIVATLRRRRAIPPGAMMRAVGREPRRRSAWTKRSSRRATASPTRGPSKASTNAMTFRGAAQSRC